MKKIIFVQAILLSFLFQSCGFLDGTPLWLDNPTSELISVEVSGEKYDIAPGELKRIDGKKGKQKYKGVDGKELEIDVTGPSLINCTNSTYIVQSIEYSTTGLSNNLPETVDVEVDGVKYNGNFEIFKDVVVPSSDINYDVITPLKDEIEFTGSKNFIIVKKMYRSKDFLTSPDTKDYKL